MPATPRIYFYWTRGVNVLVLLSGLGTAPAKDCPPGLEDASFEGDANLGAAWTGSRTAAYNNEYSDQNKAFRKFDEGRNPWS
jgi:hypothetical protein